MASVVITEQPQNTTITVGSNAVFSVSVSVNSPFGGYSTKYQWYRNNVPITDTRILTYGPVELLDNGYKFKCTITVENFEPVTSNEVLLTVIEANITPETPKEPEPSNLPSVDYSYTSLYQVQTNGINGFYNNYKDVTGPNQISLRTLTEDSLTKFRFWIPPNITLVDLSSHKDQGDINETPYLFVARLDTPPTSTPDLSKSTNTGFTLEQLKNECFGTEDAGYIFYLNSNTTIGITETGHWLYINLQKGSLNFKDTQSMLFVNYDNFKEWFDSTTWDTYGDPVNEAEDDSGGEEDSGEAEDDSGTRPTFPPCTSVMPPASVLANEFFNLQDLDGNGLIYGYDFKITDDNHIPPWKPILLITLEDSPYWKSPTTEKEWLTFLEEMGYPGGGGGGGGTSGNYKIEKLAEINDYLWQLSAVNGKLYSGSYNDSGIQCYYSASSPYSSFTKTTVSGSEEHESTRTYNLNGTLYVTTEGLQGTSVSSSDTGGALVLPNGTKTTGFDRQFSLSATYFNGSYLIGWCKRNADNASMSEGTYIYSCPPSGGKTLKKYIPEVMAFCMEVYNNKLYLIGCKKDSFYRDTTNAGILVEVDSSFNYKVIQQPSSFGIGSWITVFDNKLFCMYTKNSGVYSYDGTNFKSELDLGSSFNIGGACVANNTLILPISGSGTAEVRARKSDEDGGTWSTIISNSNLTAIGGQPTSTTLGASGYCTTIEDSAYICYVLNDQRTGPSAIYKLSGDGSSSSEIDLSQVVWLDEDVSEWEETSVLSSVSISGNYISMPFDKTNTWPTEVLNSTENDVNANPWVFIYQDNKWYASTWEWFRKGSYTKESSCVDGNHMKKESVFSLSWKPTSGVSYGFMVSALARLDNRTVSERSNVVMFTWP